LKDTLLLTPPFTQLNTPYPATAYLKGFLNTKHCTSFQVDLGIEVILSLFTAATFRDIFQTAEENNVIESDNAKRIYALREDYLRLLDPVIHFLQGKDPTYARILATDYYLPQASRFDQLDDMDWAFGAMGTHDKARHYATLFLEDLSDFYIECIDDQFGFSRYAERLGMSANSFDELYDRLQGPQTFTDQITLSILDVHMAATQPKLVCMSVPFPGNLYSAFRCAQYIKMHLPGVAIAMGGGFANTELRSLSDPRVFEFFDYITLDDGELPIELLVSNVRNPNADNPDFGLFKRTFLLENGKVVYNDRSMKSDYNQPNVGTPDYSDLKLKDYISVIEIANPMHSLWSDGRWNKLTMAHGCYWAKCTFCDVSLDYISRYEPIAARLLVDRMEEIIAQTGETGFHFVDEAAPPKLMKELAIEIIRRKLTVTWWTNIRFEKNFTYDLCQLLKASGCIAVSGGLEVASDRLLKLIDKGVTVSQVARVTRNFTEADIMVHAYLMYGYPTQTVQETVDSLEMVRQMFEQNIIQSGFWHQFALTAHSPIGLNPDAFGVIPQIKDVSFANNDVQYTDRTGIDHSQFSYGLKKSLFNFMHGIGFDATLQSWFEFKIPRTTIPQDYIATCLRQEADFEIKGRSRIVWLGALPQLTERTKVKKGRKYELVELSFHDKHHAFTITLEPDHGRWFAQVLPRLKPAAETALSFEELRKDFESRFENFELFWHSRPVGELRDFGLLIL
jgi:hypothetical protein